MFLFFNIFIVQIWSRATSGHFVSNQLFHPKVGSIRQEGGGGKNLKPKKSFTTNKACQGDWKSISSDQTERKSLLNWNNRNSRWIRGETIAIVYTSKRDSPTGGIQWRKPGIVYPLFPQELSSCLNYPVSCSKHFSIFIVHE